MTRKSRRFWSEIHVAFLVLNPLQYNCDIKQVEFIAREHKS